MSFPEAGRRLQIPASSLYRLHREGRLEADGWRRMRNGRQQPLINVFRLRRVWDSLRLRAPKTGTRTAQPLPELPEPEPHQGEQVEPTPAAPHQVEHPAEPAAPPPAAPPPAGADWFDPDAPPGIFRPDGRIDAVAARAWKEVEAARRAAVERRAAEGKYLQVKDAEKAWGRAFGSLKQAVMGIPSKLRNDFADSADPTLLAEVERLCRAALEAAAESIKQGASADDDQEEGQAEGEPPKRKRGRSPKGRAA